MTDQTWRIPITLEIDRICLSGIDLSPDQAEQVRLMAEADVARALHDRQQGSTRARSIDRLTARPLRFDASPLISHLSTHIAGVVLDAVNGSLGGES